MRTIHRSPYRDANGKTSRDASRKAREKLRPNWKQIYEGEDKAARHLGAALDDRYVVIRNANLPEAGEIDMILVGPTGIWVLASYHTGGMYKAEAELWLRYDSRQMQFVREPYNPIQQARQVSRHLREHLHAQNLPVPWVNAALLLTNADVRLTLEGPAISIVGLDEIDHFVSSEILSQETVMDNEDVDAVITAILEYAVGDGPVSAAAGRTPAGRRVFMGLTRSQIALLVVLALLNICVLGGFLFLVLRNSAGV